MTGDLRREIKEAMRVCLTHFGQKLVTAYTEDSGGGSVPIGVFADLSEAREWLDKFIHNSLESRFSNISAETGEDGESLVWKCDDPEGREGERMVLAYLTPASLDGVLEALEFVD